MQQRFFVVFIKGLFIIYAASLQCQSSRQETEERALGTLPSLEPNEASTCKNYFPTTLCWYVSLTLRNLI